MVRVPLPQEQQRVVGSPGFTAPRTVPVQDFTGQQIRGIGQALERSGGQIADRAADEELRLSSIAVQKAQAVAEEFILEADGEYRSRVGADATGQHRTDAWEALNKRVSAVEAGLPQGIAREFFSDNIGRRLMSFREQWGRHEQRELRVAEIGAAKAGITSKTRFAMRAEPEDRAARLKELRDHMMVVAELEGTTPEQAALDFQAQATGVHEFAVRGMLANGRVTDAREYLEDVSAEEIDPVSRQRLGGIIQAKSVGVESIGLAMQLQDEAADEFRKQRHEQLREQGFTGIVTDREIGFLSAAQEEFMARQLLEERFRAGDVPPEVFQATRAELRSQGQERRKDEALSQERARLQTEQYFQANSGSNMTTLRRDLPELWRTLWDNGDTDLMAQYAANDNNFPWKLEMWAEVDSVGMAEESEAEFINKYRSTLPGPVFQEKLQAWRKAHGVAGPEHDPAIPERLEAVLYELGGVDKDSPEGLRLYLGAVEAVRTEQAALGRKLHIDEKTRAIHSVGRDQVRVVHTFLGVDRVPLLAGDERRPITSFTPEEQAEFNADATPTSSRLRIEDADVIAEYRRQHGTNAVLPFVLARLREGSARAVPLEVGKEITKQLRARGIFPSQAAVRLEWLLNDSPKTLAEAREAGRQEAQSRAFLEGRRVLTPEEAAFRRSVLAPSPLDAPFDPLEF